MAVKVRTSLKLDKEVKTEAQIKALRSGVTLQEAVERLLREWVEGTLALPAPAEDAPVRSAPAT
ncbi:MAG: hypothetical protein M5U01_09400 [Ardenticatenaceae bacterium]|nr:hypothetical protein [Ardenticatenaceae bacterium]